jgi:hypothetical protein
MDESPCALCEEPTTDGATFCSEKCVTASQWVPCTWCGSKRGESCVGTMTHPIRLMEARDYVKRLLETPIEEMIDRSSLGTAEAKYLRGQADKSVVDRVLARADELQPLHLRHFRGRK